MANRHDITPDGRGGFRATKRPGMFWWVIYSLMILGLLIAGPWEGKLIAVVFLFVMVPGLYARRHPRKAPPPTRN
jgi:hypothetical protein